MILFADDTNLFLYGPNLDDICIQLNLEIKKKFKMFWPRSAIKKDKFRYNDLDQS